MKHVFKSSDLAKRNNVYYDGYYIIVDAAIFDVDKHLNAIFQIEDGNVVIREGKFRYSYPIRKALEFITKLGNNPLYALVFGMSTGMNMIHAEKLYSLVIEHQKSDGEERRRLINIDYTNNTIVLINRGEVICFTLIMDSKIVIIDLPMSSDFLPYLLHLQHSTRR
jgi:hypothetical protein